MGVAPLLQNVWVGQATVDGQLRTETDPLVASQGGSQSRRSKKGQQQKDSASKTQCGVQLLLSLVGSLWCYVSLQFKVENA